MWFIISINRSKWNTAMLSGLLALKKNRVLSSIVLVCLADGLVGVSYGAVSVTAGLELWVPLTLAILVLAGASEFLFVGILAAGGSPLMAALAGLLVNIRLLPFGLSVQQQLGSGPLSYFGCHLLNDESVVFAVSQPTPAQRKTAFWLCGLGILLMWPLGVYLGGVLGALVEDTAVFGLDALFPAILLALVVPGLKSLRQLTATFSGAALTLLATPFLAAGLPAVLSIAGVYLGKKLHAK